jgi:hypothetical protein
MKNSLIVLVTIGVRVNRTISQTTNFSSFNVETWSFANLYDENSRISIISSENKNNRILMHTYWLQSQ